MTTEAELRIGRRLQGAKLDEVKQLSSSLRDAAASLEALVSWAEEGVGEGEANAMPTMERRAFTLDEIHVERRSDAAPIIRGHAAVFDQLSEPLGAYRERIKPGAFTKTLREGDVRALFNHDPNLILGRTKSGTVRVSQDAAGLAFEIDPPDTTYAKDLLVSIARGDVDQASFAFQAVKDRMVTEEGESVRELLEVKLYDVSPVTYPAYPQTDTSVREVLQAASAVLTRTLAIVSESSDSPDPSRADAHSGDDDDSEPGGRPLALKRRRLELMERVCKPTT
jgi:HK97 family phage prohead protease